MSYLRKGFQYDNLKKKKKKQGRLATFKIANTQKCENVLIEELKHNFKNVLKKQKKEKKKPI